MLKIHRKYFMCANFDLWNEMFKMSKLNYNNIFSSFMAVFRLQKKIHIHFSWWCQSFNASDIMMDGLRLHCLIDSKRFVFMKLSNTKEKRFNISAQLYRRWLRRWVNCERHSFGGRFWHRKKCVASFLYYCFCLLCWIWTF